MRKIKEVLRLKYECNLSYDQIATICKISKGTVVTISVGQKQIRCEIYRQMITPFQIANATL